ncbi:MAG: hypothetical protein ACOYT4_00585 [Nanoarchaeota archaeon]
MENIEEKIYQELKNGSKEIYDEGIYIIQNGIEIGGHIETRHYNAMLAIPEAYQIAEAELDDVDCAENAIFRYIKYQSKAITAITNAYSRYIRETSLTEKDKSEIYDVFRIFLPSIDVSNLSL